MNSGTFRGGSRGGVFVRVAAVFLVLVVLVWLGLPHAQSAYDDYKAGQPFLHSDTEHADTPSHELDTPIPYTSAPPASQPTSEVVGAVQGQAECLSLPGADKVMVILKTGATELYQKLPVHFVTTFLCTPHYTIYSDLEQEFGGVHIHDAIAPVTPKRRKQHEDFKLYREINEWWGEGQDMGELKGNSGWNLDKWKFLPMFHHAFKEAPDNIEWFFMMEADTSMSWLNLLLWIQHLDSSKPYYMGAQNMLGETVFGHGGSGVLISRAAARILEAERDSKGHQAYDEAWEEKTAMTCCGDAIVAMAFLEVDIPLTGSWPIIQGETVNTVDFTGFHWCQPPVTWHHVSSIQVDAMWHYEQQWTEKHGWDTPFLYRDVFEHFVEEHISLNRSSWNNISKDNKYVDPSLLDSDKNDEYNDGKLFAKLEDYERESVESPDACADACRIKEHNCVQWMFQKGRCYLGRDVRFGMSDERESEHWESGWLVDRIKAENEKRNQDCKPRWISD